MLTATPSVRLTFESADRECLVADYTHGDMAIGEQKATFSTFMHLVVWSCALTAVSLIFLTLHFAVGLGWFVSLGVAFVVGILIGLGLGLKSAWYGSLIGLTLLTGFIGIVALVVGALLA